MNTGQELAISTEIAMAKREMRPKEYALVVRVLDAAKEYQQERNELLDHLATFRRAMAVLYTLLFGTDATVPLNRTVVEILDQARMLREDIEQLYADTVGPDPGGNLDQMVNEVMADGDEFGNPIYGRIAETLFGKGARMFDPDDVLNGVGRLRSTLHRIGCEIDEDWPDTSGMSLSHIIELLEQPPIRLRVA